MKYDYIADVCIVGAGPAGALLAYLLASHNISVILLERHAGINKEFRGEHLNETGEAILQKYGLFKELEKIGLLRMKKVEYWHQGEVFKTITPEPGVDHVGIHVPQKHLLGLFRQKSESLSDYTLLMNTKAVGLIEESQQYIGVKALKDGKEITIKSSLIVGADGRFSTIRQLAQIPYHQIKHGYDLLWARIPVPKGWEPTIKMALVNNAQLALFTQQGGYVQIGWNIEEDSYHELRKQSFTPFIRQLTAAFPELEERVQSYIESWNDFILLQVHSTRCETWTKKGLVIIGDAAHTMSPTGAFGINSAMKDADVLFQVLKEAEFKGEILNEDLRRFERLRRQEVEDQQDTQLEEESTFGNKFPGLVI